jgi:hypothetical protein
MVNQKKQCAVLLCVEPGGGEIVGWDCQTHCYTTPMRVRVAVSQATPIKLKNMTPTA